MSLLYNNTHYYCCNNKLFNEIPDSTSWEFESSKRQSYSQRLYWEFEYCKSVGGQAFFYTFTYNDASLPHFDCKRLDIKSGEWKDYSFPCFSYDHIRLLTNGLISKILRRQYGSQMRYFVACERGEGKGWYRKKGMNPHYHVIFFVFPLSPDIRKDKDPEYKPIPPGRFLHLCRSVWQYKSTHDRSYKRVKCDYKSARFGHCQPGDDCGLISDFDALSYVSKYVVKDSVQYSDDLFVKSYYKDYVFKDYAYTTHAVYYYYIYLRSIGVVVDRQDFLDTSGLSHYILWRSCMSSAKLYPLRHEHDFLTWLGQHYPEYDDFWHKDFADFFKRVYVPHFADYLYREYVNKFGAKVRTSKSLGLYGLQFVRDELSNPHFVIDKKDEKVTQPICLYYYRKLYMNVEYCPVSGNPLYVLNDKGVQLRCFHLDYSIHCNEDLLKVSFDYVFSNINNEKLVSLLEETGVNLNSLQQFKSLEYPFTYTYSVYRTVYQYRSFDKYHPCSLTTGIRFEDVLSDYRNFLYSNYYTLDYQVCSIRSFIETSSVLRQDPESDTTIYSFAQHPAFAGYIENFDICDKVIRVVSDFKGQIKRKEFADAQYHRQALSACKYS